MKIKFILRLMAVFGAAGLLYGCATPEPASSAPAAQRAPTAAQSAGVVYENDLLRVTKERDGSRSGLVSVGSESVHLITVLAKQSIANVVIAEHFPGAIEYISSTPPGSQSDGRVEWALGTMHAGETQTIRIRSTANQRGTFSVCSVVRADPMICLPIQVGAPDLLIAKTGDRSVEVGETATWTVTVTNTGDSSAQNVRIDDLLPEHFTAGTPVGFNVGTLEPGQSRDVIVSARAEEVGSFINRAVANYAGGEEIAAEAPIRVVQSGIDVEKTGATRAYALMNERFTITVRNSGDTTLEDVQVVDRLPANIQLGSVDGGTVASGPDGQPETITWNVGRLAAGASRSFNVVMTSGRPGTTINTAVASAERDLRAFDRQETEWVAVPAIQTSVTDNVDPIRVGESIVYTLLVMNQSPLEPIRGASINVRFPAEVRPVRVGTGPVSGTVRDRTVRFESVNLEPGQQIVITIEAVGEQAGFATVIMETSTNFREAMVVDQESTTVY